MLNSHRSPMRRAKTWWAGVTLTLLGVSAIAIAADRIPFVKRPKEAPRSLAPAPAPGTPQPGAPLAGLTAAQLADFNGGREEFVAVETPEGGLGPIFNNDSCVACHSAGGVGGASTQTVTRFGRLTQGQFDDLARLGGSLQQARAIDAAALERVPREATITTRRVTTPLFGAGLMEAIADGTLEQNARQPQPDGVHGRVSYVLDVATGQRRVGRFGWKAQHATLLAFAGDAYLNEMGVTSRFFPHENAPNGRADLLARFDKLPDPEDVVEPDSGKGDIDHAADFMRLLAPAPTQPPTADSLAGQRLFENARCVACHTPVLMTGNNLVAALAHKPVPLYSDLLLHDMGALGDGIGQEAARGRDMRTAPLWGLRLRPAYLHDGRARTVEAAIEAHDGEATPSRRRFQAMTPTEKQQLVAFLRTL
jgi:CxxC motif-containing protein (DUF1111 family)